MRPFRPHPRHSLVVLLTGLAVLPACAGDAVGNGGDVRAELEAVTRLWEASLIAGRPAAAVADVFTEDAIRLPALEEPVRGRAAIAEALAGSVALAEARFDLAEIEARGDLAYATGSYSVRTPDGQTLTGKFLEVWKRTSEGWRIHRVMWD